MYVCMYVCMYVYVCEYIYVYTYILLRRQDTVTLNLTYASFSITQPWKGIFMDLLKFCTCLSDSTFPLIVFSFLKKLAHSISKTKLERLRERNAKLKNELYVSCYNYIINSLINVMNIGKHGFPVVLGMSEN
jgi:hypothetical protein